MFELAELARVRRAIVVLDVVESVCRMAEDEARFIRAWRHFVQRVRDELLPAHRGTLVKSLGDGLLLQFNSVTDALTAALAMLALSDAPLAFRIGMHTADVVIDDVDMYGNGVNLAARLCSLARPGEIVVSSQLRDALADGAPVQVTDLGEWHLKHFVQPVRAFRVMRAPLDTTDAAMAGMAAFSAVLPVSRPAPVEPFAPCVGVATQPARTGRRDMVRSRELIARSRELLEALRAR